MCSSVIFICPVRLRNGALHLSLPNFSFLPSLASFEPPRNGRLFCLCDLAGLANIFPQLPCGIFFARVLGTRNCFSELTLLFSRAYHLRFSHCFQPNKLWCRTNYQGPHGQEEVRRFQEEARGAAAGVAQGSFPH